MDNKQINDIIKNQTEERTRILEQIKLSKHPKKIIVAGPGTGKSYTFSELLQNESKGERLAMSFINKLVDQMKVDLEDKAAVYTLHHYCKMILHKKRGKFELAAYLSKIIKSDATLLDFELSDFDSKFQKLEGGDEIKFYIDRGDYYGAVCFNDCLYRLLTLIKEDSDHIPTHDLILIDEFQDFNPLEVAVIEALEQKANIVIVGDDDQAIYAQRDSSPEHIRRFYAREDYQQFNLPYCGRCTKVIVDATNAIIETAKTNKNFQGRINKRYECFIADKGDDSKAFPKIIAIQVPLLNAVTKFIDKEIMSIPEEEIKESLGKYPTVLIVGPGQYLKPIYQQMSSNYSDVQYKPSTEYDYDLFEGYIEILRDNQSNLGWRIVCEFLLDEASFKELLKESYLKGTPFISKLNEDFVKNQIKIAELVKKIMNNEDLTGEEKKFISENSKTELAAFYDKLATIPLEKEKPTEQKLEPTILFTSFEGCKGLSASRVFILGMNNCDFPRDIANITDVEVSKLIVAITRTRECCYLISNKGIKGLRNRNGEWIGKNKSVFYKWIPDKLISDLGYKKTAEI